MPQLYKDKECTIGATCPMTLNLYTNDLYLEDKLHNCWSECAWCAKGDLGYYCAILPDRKLAPRLYAQEFNND